MIWLRTDVSFGSCSLASSVVSLATGRMHPNDLGIRFQRNIMAHYLGRFSKTSFATGIAERHSATDVEREMRDRFRESRPA